MQEQMAKSFEEKKKKLIAASRDSTPPMYNSAETDIMELFPINIYNEPMDWLLKQRIVQRFIYFDVMRLVYRSHPVFKPECDWVTARYMDYLLSQRLQTHFTKATDIKRKTDYSRVPMPKVVLEIAEVHMKDLGKRRAPGVKGLADFMKDRCNSNRRVHLLNSAHVQAAKSIQEFAWLIMAERVDFVEKHDVSLPNDHHISVFSKCNYPVLSSFAVADPEPKPQLDIRQGVEENSDADMRRKSQGRPQLRS